MSVAPASAAFLASVLAAAVVTGSCGAGSDEPPLPPAAQVVRLAQRDFHFRYRPPSSPGRTVFTVTNEGRRRHELLMLPLPDGFPPIRDQVTGEHRRAVGTLAFVKPLRPKKSGTFAVDLRHGRYALVCLLETSRGVTHAKRGMATEFRIR